MAFLTFLAFCNIVKSVYFVQHTFNEMERREDALREALASNSNEIERWERYKKENEVAIDNLNKFIKNLTVEVMVPIGRKAFVPGELIHTNEVLVGHFQGYFSKCSAHKAKEICQLRLRSAVDHLKQLEKEAELWQHNLEEPYMKGALPTAEQQDITEFVEEEEHAKWMERHKILVRNMKLKEKELREKVPKYISIENEEDDLLEELGNDLKELNVSELNEDALSKLLSGVSINTKDDADLEKPSTSNTGADSNEIKAHEQTQKPQDIYDIMKMLEEKERVEKENNEYEEMEVDSNAIDVTRQLMSGSLKTKETRIRISPCATKSDDELKNLKNKELKANDIHPSNFVPQKSALKQSTQELKKVEEEVEIVRQEANYLPLEDRIGFYEFQIQIMQEKSRKLSKSKSNYQSEKTRLLDVIVTLTEDLEGLQDKLVLSGDLVSDADDDVEKKDRRRISFAPSEQTLEFSQNETVAEMLLPKGQQPKQSMDIDLNKDHKRDIITLDDPIIPIKPTPAKPNKNFASEIKKVSILDKVAQNLDFIMENQSEQDVDLIGNILNESAKHNKTLQIRFKHSEANPSSPHSSLVQNVGEDEPGTPADFYQHYLKLKGEKSQGKPVYLNAYEGEDEIKIPLLNETERVLAFKDPKTAFSSPGALKMETGSSSNIPEVKPIIRNKSAVEQETHVTDEKIHKKSKQKKKPIVEDDCGSAYLKVMNEVAERAIIEEPEPLPQGNFVDANAPRKRISRFKKNRFSTYDKHQDP